MFTPAPPKKYMYPPATFRDVRSENHVRIPDAKFSEEEDPTRLVHCLVSFTQVCMSDRDYKTIML